jgi:hypothetical protein
MKNVLIYFLLTISLSLDAHYPIDRIQMIGLSELIVTGEVISINVNYFYFKVDSLISGTLSGNVILISHKKDQQNIIRSNDSNYYENFNNYQHEQKLMLFLKREKTGSEEIIWSSVGNYDEAEMKIFNDTIFLESSVFANKEKYSIYNFIDAVVKFENFFKIEISKAFNSIIIKQIVSEKKLIEFNKSNCHNSFLEILINYNRLHKWKRNEKWIKTYEGYLPFNGKYELANPHNNLIEYKGKFKKGIQIEHKYVGND